MQKIVLKNSCFCVLLWRNKFIDTFLVNTFSIWWLKYFSVASWRLPKKIYFEPWVLLSQYSQKNYLFCEVKNITFFFLFHVIFHVDNNHNTLHLFIKFKSFFRTFSSFSPFFRVLKYGSTPFSLISRGEHKAIAHKVDKLTTVLYSPFPEVPSTRPKKTCLIRGWVGRGFRVNLKSGLKYCPNHVWIFFGNL